MIWGLQIKFLDLLHTNEPLNFILTVAYLGKNEIIFPNLKIPRSKNTTPVRIVLRAYATTIVAKAFPLGSFAVFCSIILHMM